MNAFAKRALILTLLVLCLFGITILGTSALDYEIGATEQGDAHVASAKVDGQTLYFESLTDALAQADTGSTVTILRAVALDSTVNISREGATLALDLGNRTVAIDAPIGIHLQAGTLSVYGGMIEVTGEAFRMGEKTTESAANATVLTLGNSLTVHSTTDSCVVAYAGTLYTSATLISDSTTYTAVCGSGASVSATVINIVGGSITSTYDVAIYHPQAGSLNIEAGTITGATAVYVKAGSVNITGGTFIANGERAEYTVNNNGCQPTGDAIVIENANYPAEISGVSITGGTFTSTTAAAVASYANTTVNTSLTPVAGFVTGGTFTSAEGVTLDEAVIAEDSALTDLDGDGVYDVQDAPAEGESFVARIGSVGYTSFANAWAAANAGDTIVLLYADEVTTSDFAISIDGKAVTVTADATLTRDALAVEFGAAARIGDAYYSSAKNAYNAANGGASTTVTIYILKDYNHDYKVALGSTTGDKSETVFANASITLIGVQIGTDGDGNPIYPTITNNNTNAAFYIYNAADFTLQNINFTTGARFYQTRADGTASDPIKLTLGQNVKITIDPHLRPSYSGNLNGEDTFNIGHAYFEFTLAATASIEATYDKQGQNQILFLGGGANAVYHIYGSITLDATNLVETVKDSNDKDVPKSTSVFGQTALHNVYVYNGASISFTTDGSATNAYAFWANAVVRFPDMDANAALAAAQGYGLYVQFTDASDVTWYSHFKGALANAKDNSTLTVICDGVVLAGGTVSDKTLTITALPGVTVTSSIYFGTTGLMFQFSNNANVTFTNITFDIGCYFGRTDGATVSITFGEGFKAITSNTIFLYSNHNAPQQTSDVTIDFGYGSEIDFNAGTGHLFYHNGSKDWNGDSTSENRIVNATIYVSGKISTDSSSNGVIANDANNNAAYTVYYNASTAEITAPNAASWFYLTENPGAVYITGVSTAAEADAIAYRASLAVRSGAKAGTNGWVYTGFRGQIHQNAIERLPEGENTLYILEDIGSINGTLHFRGTLRSTFNMVSHKADGSQATIKFQGGDYRLQVHADTSLTIDGVNLTANGDGATDNTKGRIIQLNGGKLTLKNLTLTAYGNNASAPFKIASTTRSTLTIEGCTINATADLFHVATGAHLADIIVDASTLTVSDTALDFRNTNADADISLKLQNGTVGNISNLIYATTDTKGKATLTVDASTLGSTAPGKILNVDGNSAVDITLNIQNSSNVSATSVLVASGTSAVLFTCNFEDSTVSTTSHMFYTTSTGALRLKLDVKDTTLTAQGAAILRLEKMGKPAEGAGLKDAAGTGNYGVVATFEGVTITNCTYIVCTYANTFCDVSVTFNGSKTGVGANATHTNTVNASGSGVIYFYGAAYNKFVANGLKITATSHMFGLQPNYVTDGTAIEVIMEGVTLSNNGRFINGNDRADEIYGGVKFTIKDSNVTNGDSTTYSNEISMSGELGMLLRKGNTWDVSFEGCLITSGNFYLIGQQTNGKSNIKIKNSTITGGYLFNSNGNVTADADCTINLEYVDYTTSSSTAAIPVSKPITLTMDHCTVTATAAKAIHVTAAAKSIELTDCTIKSDAHTAFHVASTAQSITLTDCTIHSVVGNGLQISADATVNATRTHFRTDMTATNGDSDKAWYAAVLTWNKDAVANLTACTFETVSVAGLRVNSGGQAHLYGADNYTLTLEREDTLLAVNGTLSLNDINVVVNGAQAMCCNGTLATFNINPGTTITFNNQMMQIGAGTVNVTGTKAKPVVIQGGIVTTHQQMFRFDNGTETNWINFNVTGYVTLDNTPTDSSGTPYNYKAIYATKTGSLGPITVNINGDDPTTTEIDRGVQIIGGNLLDCIVKGTNSYTIKNLTVDADGSGGSFITAMAYANTATTDLTTFVVENVEIIRCGTFFSCDTTASQVNLSVKDSTVKASNATLNFASATVPVNVTIENSTFANKGANAVTVNGSFAFTGNETYDLGSHASSLAEADSLAQALNFAVRVSDTEYLYRFAFNMDAANEVTANATKAGTLYVLNTLPSGVGALTLGDGSDADSNFKIYDLTIIGLKLNGLAEFPTITYNGELFVLYDGSDLTLSNINIYSNNRWMRIYNKTNLTDPCDIVFGAGTTVSQLTTASNDDYILVTGVSAANITVEAGATLSRILTAASTTGYKGFFSIFNMKGSLVIEGTVICKYNAVMNAAATPVPTPCYLVYLTEGYADVTIKSGASITWEATGETQNCRPFYNFSLPIVIEDNVSVNGTAYQHAWQAAQALNFVSGFTNNATDKYSFNQNISGAITYAKPGTTVMLLRDYAQGNFSVYNQVTLTSAPNGPFTVTNSDTDTSHIFIVFYHGANVTFENIIFNVTSRLFRVDGQADATTDTIVLTFGQGSKFISNNSIFGYANSNGKKQVTNLTMNLLAGSEIQLTGSAKVFYHNMSLDFDSDGTTEWRTVNLTAYVNGKITSKNSIFSNQGGQNEAGNAVYTIYVDLSTAEISSTGSRWFYLTEDANYDNVVYVTGVESLAEADAFAVGANLLARSGAKFGEGIWIPYTGFRGQISNLAIEYLPEGENTLYILQNVSSINATLHFRNSIRESFRIVGATPSRAMPTIGFQGDAYRAQVFDGASLTIDGVEIVTKGITFQLHGGTTDNRTELIFTNGAKVTATISATSGANARTGVLSVNTNACINFVLGEGCAINQTGAPTKTTTLATATDIIYINSGVNATFTIAGTMTKACTGNGTDVPASGLDHHMIRSGGTVTVNITVTETGKMVNSSVGKSAHVLYFRSGTMSGTIAVAGQLENHATEGTGEMTVVAANATATIVINPTARFIMDSVSSNASSCILRVNSDVNIVGGYFEVGNNNYVVNCHTSNKQIDFTNTVFKLNGARGLRNGGAGQTKLVNVAFENDVMAREATDGTYSLVIRVGDPTFVGGTGAYAAFANCYYDFFTALDLAIENGEIMYFVGDMYNFSSQNYVTLGNTDATVTAPESVVFMGINLGTPENPVWPIIKQTAANRVISLYDGSDIEMYNLDIQVQSRLIQVYDSSSAADHTNVVFGANTTLSLYTETLGAESLIHTGGSAYVDYLFDEGSLIEFIVTLNPNAENTAQRRVIMDFGSAGGGSLTFKGTIRMIVTDNSTEFADEFSMFKASGSIQVHVYSTAAFEFYAPVGNEPKAVAMNVQAPFFLYGFTAEAGDQIVNDMQLGVKVVSPNGDQIASSNLSGIMGVVPSGSTLYLYRSFNDYNIPVGGQFTITPKGDDAVTINNNSAGSPLFVFTTGSKDAPVKLWIDNVNITGTSTGNTFHFHETAYAIVDLKNVTVDQATANYAFYVAGSATLSLTLKDVEITTKSGFYVIENTTFSMTVDGLKMTNTSYSIHTACESGNPIVINLKNSEINSNVALYFLNPSNVRAAFDNVNFETIAWVVSSQAQAKLELDFNNCTLINDKAHVLRTYGTAGSYVNINNCTMISSLAAPGVYTYCSSYPAAVIAGSALTMNIYGGYFQSSGAAVIATLSTTSVINVYGGTFNYVGNYPGVSPVMNDQGTVNIYGGDFRTETTIAPVFGNGNRATNTMNLYSFVANGPANLITNLGLGTPSANHTTGYGHTTLNGLRMTTGATPDFTASAMGMKFMVTLDAATYAHICSLADNATATTAEVSYGMLLVETSKLTDELASNFSHYGFNRLGFTDVIELIATSANVVNEADGCVTVTLTLTEDQMASISTAYSVVAYAKYTINGNTVYMYSNYNSAKNSRSLEQIARSAYNDRAVAADSIYTVLVSEGSYSRYTAEQLAQLATWCNDDTAQKVMDIYLVAGGSNAMGLTSYNKQFADAITNADILSSNVFYSGLVSQHALQDLTVSDYYATASKYTVSGSLADLGYGWLASQIGPELGMAKALSEQYNADSGKYAAIVKYAFADSNLLDILEGYDESAGNWAPTSETPAGEKSGALYTAYMNLVANELRNYVDQGYKVNIVGMYWMQGEDDIAAEANTTYAEQFSKFVANARMSLSTIYMNETGSSIDLTAMPVAVGEVATFLGNGLDSKRDAFATLQNTFAGVMTDGMLTSGIAGVSIIPTSQFPADEDGIFLNPDDVLLAGELAAALLMQKGSNSLADGTVIETPVITPAATIVDIDGNPVLGEDEQPLAYRSLAMAAALAPANSTLKLAGDQTAYATLSFKNLKNLTIDGDNHTITFESDDTGFVISGTVATLKNVQIVHNGSAPAIVADKNTTLTLSGANTSVEAETTAIVMEGANSRLVIEDGTYATRSATGLATDSIIYTTSAHVVIEDGTFTAADGATCLIIDEDAPTKLAVNVKGGTFSASDLIADTNVIKAPAFVNMSVVAILVISPEALVTTSQDTEICANMGFGTNGALNDAFN